MVYLTVAPWFFLLLVSQCVLGQLVNFTNIEQSQCVAPDVYLTCYEAVVQNTANCVQMYQNQPDAKQACACVDGEEKMNCYAAACWSRVYSCEYQAVVSQYLALCPIPASVVPFWPAPDNAPGGCSCNTGVVIETILNMKTQLASCAKGVTTSERIYECACCGLSIGISTLYDVCPNTNNTATLNYFLEAGSTYDFSYSECASYLQDVDCVNGLGFEAPLSTGVIYNPTNTPAMGTQTLFDLPGEVTVPPSGAVFTWSAHANGATYTVTALSPEALLATTATGAGAPSVTGGSGSENTVTGAAGSSTGVASGTGSSAGTTKSSASGLLPSTPMLVGSLMMLGFIFSSLTNNYVSLEHLES